MRPRTLRARLLLTVVALLAAVGCVIGVVTTLALRHQLVEQVDERLSALRGHGVVAAHGGRHVELTCPELQVGPGFGELNLCYEDGRLVTATAFDRGREEGRRTLPAADVRQLEAVAAAAETVGVPARGVGTAGAGRGGPGGPGPEDPDREDRGPRTVALSDGSTYRVRAVRDADGTVVVSGVSLAQTRRVLSRVVAVEVAAITGGVALAALLGGLLVRRDLAPLQRVARTAARVSELPLDRGEVALAERVPAADTDPASEVGQVAAALNRMLDHVGSALHARHVSEQRVRRFVADASHELRTPLAAIRGYAELTRRRGPGAEVVPADVGHALRRVESEAVRMSGLVDDLLLLARLDAGRPLAVEEVDVTMLVLDAVSDARAASPEHRWHLDLPGDVVTTCGDPARLHQVLANLLANARTHTPPGTTVTVRVAREGPAGGGRVVLGVTDDGPGIDPAVLPHVFERFARADTSRSRAAGSTGLGLAIVDAVVSAHGGAVGVDSSPAGTTFRVELPVPGAGPSAVTTA
ncbi:sensor histidine kinase [Kineococcus sp. NUM-3379]